jgi:DNA-binding CsgD family transcriptional regulator
MAFPAGRLVAETAEVTDITTAVGAVAEALRFSVGAGPVFVATTDPGTGAFAGSFLFDIPELAAAEFFANEMSGTDVVPFRSLARAPAPIASLFETTEHRPKSSARWRDIIEPLGWGDELRGAVRGGGSTWGYVCLHREAGERAFDDQDAARLSEFLPAIAGLLRRVTISEPADYSRLGSGVLLVGPDQTLVGTSGAATAWIDELGPKLPSGLPIPIAAIAREVADTGQPAASTLTTRTARRGHLEAAPFDGPGHAQVVVVVSEASAEQNLSHLSLVAALTAREQQIVVLVLRGRSTKDIAGDLHISQYTVQAHLTSVFAKTGTRSRRELTSRIGR